VTDASHLVVFARRTEITEKDVNEFFHQMVSERGADAAKLEPYRQMMLGGVVKGKDAAGQKEWAARQLYIALGQLMGAAAALAIDTCALEGIDPAAYDEILGLKGTGYEVVVACAVGYRSSEDKYAGMKKIRFRPRASSAADLISCGRTSARTRRRPPAPAGRRIRWRAGSGRLRRRNVGSAGAPAPSGRARVRDVRAPG
jgi:nitroreductase